jgi:AcrR family transcriptional regulator
MDPSLVASATIHRSPDPEERNVARPTKYDDAQLLDRACDLLWRDGCDATTVRDLEVALDLQAPSLYRRFGSRAALISRSVDRYVDTVVADRIRTYLDGAADPVEGLRVFFLTVLAPMPGEERPRGCLLTTAAGQDILDDPAVHRSVRRGLDAIDRAFARTVRRAADDGRLTPGADVGAVASGLLASFEGLLVLARLGHAGLATAVDTTFAALFPY